jgi:hypothetical protein
VFVHVEMCDLYMRVVHYLIINLNQKTNVDNKGQ